MKVFLTGGTGFVGSQVLRQLAAAGHTVRVLLRAGSERKLTTLENVEVVAGDVTDAASLVGALSGCDAVIHLVGIIREFPGRGITFKKLHVEGTRNVLQAAKEQGARRYLHMSANGTRERSVAAYHRTKWQAEEMVHATTLDWTIFRPSLIFGPGGEFVTMLSELIRRLPLVPVLGDGQYRMQPVAVEQVAATFVKALDLPETVGSTYLLGGGASYSYDEILDITGLAQGKDKVAKMHQPLFLLRPMIKMLQGSEYFPITNDQLTMLLEGNVCDTKNWVKTFGIEPLSYADGIGACFRSNP